MNKRSWVAKFLTAIATTDQYFDGKNLKNLQSRHASNICYCDGKLHIECLNLQQ